MTVDEFEAAVRERLNEMRSDDPDQPIYAMIAIDPRSLDPYATPMALVTNQPSAEHVVAAFCSAIQYTLKPTTVAALQADREDSGEKELYQ